MKIETELRDDHQVKITAEVEIDLLESAKRKAARIIAKKVKIPGFRPGKAPYLVVQRQVGEAAILEDAIDVLLEDIYPKILEENEIDPYGPGKLENVESLDPPIFEFLIPLAPSVELGDFHSVRLPYEPKEIGEEDVNKILESIREQNAIVEPAERAVQEADLVFVKMSGEKIDASEDDTNKVIVEDKTYQILIDPEEVDDDYEEWPYPGFSRSLIGMTSGDEKELSYTFPQDHEIEEYQGMEAIFKVTIEEVKSRTLPEIDDEFAKTLGDYENVDELRDRVHDTLEIQEKSSYNGDYVDETIDEIIKITQIKYPPQMVEHEIDILVHRLEHRLSEQSLDIETYLKSREIDLEALNEEMRPAAEERIVRGLTLMEIANQEKIEVTTEEIEMKTNQSISEMLQFLSEKEARKLIKKDSLQGMVSQITTDEISRKTCERIRLIASGEWEVLEAEAKAKEIDEADKIEAEGESQADEVAEEVLENGADEGESAPSEEAEEDGDKD